MSSNQEILAELGFVRGGAVFSEGAFEGRIRAYTERVWPWSGQQLRGADFEAWKLQSLTLLEEAKEINLFNHALKSLRAAERRLQAVRLKEGRPELRAQVPGLERDPETGAPVLIEVVEPEIPAAPVEIERPVLDAEGVEIGSELVPNPDVVRDEAERAAAEAVIAAIPEEVKAFAAASSAS